MLLCLCICLFLKFDKNVDIRKYICYNIYIYIYLLNILTYQFEITKIFEAVRIN